MSRRPLSPFGSRRPTYEMTRYMLGEGKATPEDQDNAQSDVFITKAHDHIDSIDDRRVPHKKWTHIRARIYLLSEARQAAGSPLAQLVHPAAHPGSAGLDELEAAGSPRLTWTGEPG